MSSTIQITFDARDPRSLSIFWREAIGYVHPAPPGVQLASDGDPLEEECRRLVGLGAARLERHEPEPPTSIGFIVMADPEGNEFCLD